MNRRMVQLISIILLFLLVGVILSSCGSGTPASGGTDGASLMNQRCSVCHSVSRITSAHKTSADWTTTVQRMIDHGAQLNATEEQTLITYLAANYK